MARTETVTVVFTDLVGSTELASRLGHDAYEALRHEHFTALRAAVAKHNGTEVKTTGDGLMLRFDSAASAIACAVAMQQATDGARRGASRDPVQIRIGISSGEATHENGDLFGTPVVEAARLCAVAAGGQIVVSDVVRSLARGRGHTFTSLGELTLKGLPEPVAACEVKWEPLEPVGLPLPPRLDQGAARDVRPRRGVGGAGRGVGEGEGRPAPVGAASPASRGSARRGSPPRRRWRRTPRARWCCSAPATRT